MIRVIGLGSGRCGTHSLAALLDNQPDSNVRHERQPVRHIGCDDPCFHLRAGTEASLVGDVGFYYLHHVDRIREEFPDTKFVCLKRDKEGTLDSFARHAKNKEWFSRSTGKWCNCFPTYDCDFTEAVSRYYDEYYAIAHSLEDENFKVFPTNNLNFTPGVKEILTFVGVTDPNLLTGIRIR